MSLQVSTLGTEPETYHMVIYLTRLLRCFGSRVFCNSNAKLLGFNISLDVVMMFFTISQITFGRLLVSHLKRRLSGPFNYGAIVLPQYSYAKIVIVLHL